MLLLSGSRIDKEDLKSILRNISSIALIGASPKPERDSYKVMKFLIEYGFKFFQLIQTMQIIKFWEKSVSQI